MKQVIWRAIIAVVVLLIAGLAMYPPETKLKLGKDLAGGTTLIYGIQPDEKTGQLPPTDVIQQIVDVIKDRVDPSGVKEVSVTALGAGQIEISIPQPSERVLALRQDFETKLKSIGTDELEAGAVEAAIVLPEPERAARLADLAKGSEDRLAAMTAAATANDLRISQRAIYDERAAAREAELAPLRAAREEALDVRTVALQAVTDAGFPNSMRLIAIASNQDPVAQETEIKQYFESKPEAEAIVRAGVSAAKTYNEASNALVQAETRWRTDLDPIEQSASEAELAYENAMTRVRMSSITAEDVRRAVTADPNPLRFPQSDGTVREIPSAREDGIKRLKEAAPSKTAVIDEIAAAYDAYRAESKGFDDPKELIALLKGAGVLAFRIAARTDDGLPVDQLRADLRERGPYAVTASTDVGWYAIDKLEQWYEQPEQLESLKTQTYEYFQARHGLICDQFDGTVYMLLYKTLDRSLSEASGPWQLVKAAPSHDDVGKPAVSFGMDAAGADKFGTLTKNNIGRGMAIVLDDRVYSAPNINGQIRGEGIITGKFSQAEISYLKQVLSAGALKAKLTEEPIAQNHIGPKLGKENLLRGLNAGKWALIIIGGFMIFYYFLPGVIAAVALLSTCVVILGMMSLYQAAFTMPGIAGVILTFGTSVDANVLIYERIREELQRGESLRTAVRLGFDRAMTSIIDGNMTNLIVCFIMVNFGTSEVKGFGITIGIGVIGTLFSTVVVSRLLFELYMDVLGGTRISMLTMVFPAIHRAMEPKVRWVANRYLFWTFSATIIIVLGSVTYFYRGEMLDVEFVGGSSVTMTFKQDPATGAAMTLGRDEVDRRLKEWATREHDAGKITDVQYNAFTAAGIFNANADSAGATEGAGSEFVIRSTISETALVEQAIREAFGDYLAIKPRIEFTGAGVSPASAAPVYPILQKSLGANIGEPGRTNDVTRFVGGVAVRLAGMNPPVALEEIQERVDRVRQGPGNERYVSRRSQAIGLAPSGQTDANGATLWSDAVVVVSATDVSIYDQRELWDKQVAEKEWEIVSRAMLEPESLEQVTTISPSVAEQFRQKALVAVTLSILGILVYIWVRFGSFWYSAAAIVALMHDVVITLGMLALSHFLYRTGFGQLLLVEPFKVDLSVVAAILTIAGFSLYDTIVILDRIRENRGKLPITTAEVVDASVNQTMSRTILTGGSTLFALLVLYFEGGTGMRSFAYTMFFGIVIGTYSSVAVAAPLVCSKKSGAATTAAGTTALAGRKSATA